MNNLLVSLIAVCLQLLVTVTNSNAQPDFDTDRPGSDYRDFDLQKPEFELCELACREDPTCKAWSYVKPGIQGSNARCWLKSGVPQAIVSSCCISGAKTLEMQPLHLQEAPIIRPGEPSGTVTVKLEHDTDRPGMDYRNFDQPSPDPQLCAAACDAESQCLAFTFVQAGIQGASARCWLKSGVPEKTAVPGCVSGVKISPQNATPIQFPGPQVSGAKTSPQNADPIPLPGPQ